MQNLQEHSHNKLVVDSVTKYIYPCITAKLNRQIFEGSMVTGSCTITSVMS